MGDETRETLDEWLRLWNEHAIEDLPRLADSSYVHHQMSGIDTDIAGFQNGFSYVLAAFPDVRYTVVNKVIEGDHAAAYLLGVATLGRTSSVSTRPTWLSSSAVRITAASPVASSPRTGTSSIC